MTLQTSKKNTINLFLNISKKIRSQAKKLSDGNNSWWLVKTNNKLRK